MKSRPDAAEIVALARGGVRPIDIAAELGITRNAVSSFLTRQRVGGEDIPALPRGRRRGLSDGTGTLYAAAAALAQERLRASEIAAELGTSPANASSLLHSARKRGLDAPYGPRGRQPGQVASGTVQPS